MQALHLGAECKYCVQVLKADAVIAWCVALQRGIRGETITSIVKVEFGEKVLGESAKVECSPDHPAEFNYNATISVTFDDPLMLDELATKPVVCE